MIGFGIVTEPGAFGWDRPPPVTKTGSGTVIVDGNNTHSAATTISQGTTPVTGTLADSAVTVASGVTLGGDGQVVQSVTVSGTSPGVTYDQVSILGGGPLTYGGILDLSTSNITGAPNGTSYKLFDFSGTPSGNFASLTALGGEYSGITWSGPVGGLWTSSNGPGGSYLTFTPGTGTLTVVPEPEAICLAFIGGLGCWIARRRRA